MANSDDFASLSINPITTKLNRMVGQQVLFVASISKQVKTSFFLGLLTNIVGVISTFASPMTNLPRW